MADDIIELDEDGAFNIPSPPKQRNNHTYEVIEPTKEDIDKKLLELKSINILNTMEPGEYKIYQDTQNKSIVIFIKVSNDSKEDVREVSISKENKVIITQKNSKNNIVINVPNELKLKYDSITSKSFENIITISIETS